MATITSYRLAHNSDITLAFKPRGYPARWNSQGTVMVYSSEHLALACMEILNYWEEYTSLDGYYGFSSQFDEGLSQMLDTSSIDITDKTQTRALGDQWIASRASVALRVPSITQYGFNYLLNPEHPDFERCVKVNALGSIAFDDRIRTMIERAKERVDMTDQQPPTGAIK